MKNICTFWLKKTTTKKHTHTTKYTTLSGAMGGTEIQASVRQNQYKRAMMALYRLPEYHSTQGVYDLNRGTFLRNYFEIRQ